MFERVNIEKELKKTGSPNLILEAKKILKAAEENEKRIINNLSINTNNINPDGLDILNDENVFTLEQIKEICIKYRLRFLESSRFKSTIPYEAISKINDLEKRMNTKIERFKIIAPSELFRLEESNKDPLLFAQLSENRFYFIHKWGNDISWTRKWIAYPLRDIESFIKTILITAGILAAFIPESFLVTKILSEESVIYYRILFFAYITIASFFTFLFIGLTFRKNLSIQDWDSKTID